MKKIAFTCLLCLLVLITLVSFTSCGQASSEEQAIITEVTNGFEVYACGTHPVYVRIDILFGSSNPEDSKQLWSYVSRILQPGEKEVVYYPSFYSDQTAVWTDRFISVRPKTYHMAGWTILIVIIALIIALIIMLVSRAKTKNWSISVSFAVSFAALFFVIVDYTLYVILTVLNNPVEFTW